MATPTEQANAGDNFINKLEAARTKLAEMVTLASNVDLFPTASGSVVSQINLAYDALGKAYDFMAIDTYKARRAAG